MNKAMSVGLITLVFSSFISTSAYARTVQCNDPNYKVVVDDKSNVTAVKYVGFGSSGVAVTSFSFNHLMTQTGIVMSEKHPERPYAVEVGGWIKPALVRAIRFYTICVLD